MFRYLDNETRKKEYFQLILGIGKHSQLLNQRAAVTLSIPHRVQISRRT